MLHITDLHATVAAANDARPILKGLSLTVNAGEVHAIMGPNGAGKSTLSYVLGGRPGYEVTGGSATFDGQDLFDMEPHEREEYRATMGHLWLGFSAEQLGGWLDGAGFAAPRIVPLAPDPQAKGPALFTARAQVRECASARVGEQPSP